MLVLVHKYLHGFNIFISLSILIFWNASTIAMAILHWGPTNQPWRVIILGSRCHHFFSIYRNLLFFSIIQSGAHRSSVVDPTLLSPTHTPAYNAKNHNTKILPDICHSILPDPIQNNFTKDMTEISSQHSEELDNRNIFNENSKILTTALLFKWSVLCIFLDIDELSPNKDECNALAALWVNKRKTWVEDSTSLIKFLIQWLWL